MPLSTSLTKDVRKLLAFGFGIGVEIGATNLEVVAARVRPTGIHVVGRSTIVNYASRPAAEWGAEYAHFLKTLGAAHLSATVLLPRREVIVRQMALPGVASKDVDSAIRFQLDTLHPYGDEEVYWGWSPLTFGSVLVGIARQSVVSRYVQLFNEAGVAVSSFTFSAAAVHAAIRLNGHSEGAGFVALSRAAQRRGGSIRRKRHPPGVLRRIRSGSAARHHPGAGGVAASARDCPGAVGAGAAEAGGQPGG